MITTEKIEINGVVQGVGFRPFIYSLAHQHHVTGYVLNNPQGVLIKIQSPSENIENFVYDIQTKLPALARIDNIMRTSLPSDSCHEYKTFSIRESKHKDKPSTLISPDACVCKECLHELFDRTNPRYLYPFINCTNCGPRFTIIQNLPYDRPKTTMNTFQMCSVCQIEYDNPLNRRFHAQPNACKHCGPQLKLMDSNGMKIDGDPLLNSIKLLQQGKIIAIKALGGFQLACDTTNNEAVMRLRQRKYRDEKPFAIMCGDVKDALSLVHLNDSEQDMLTSTMRPIVLGWRVIGCGFRVSESVAPDNPYLGVMLPSTPLHYLLFYHPHAGGKFKRNESIFPALIMTSGNMSEEPIIKDNEEAISRLSSVVDAFLVHNRDIEVRCDDSIVRVSNNKPRLIRRARGFAPAPIFLKKEMPNILAVGAELKDTLCLTHQNKVFVSQYIGDLENIPTLEYFEEAITHFKKILDIEPNIIAHDLHPEYLSTKYVLEYLSSRTTHNSQPTTLIPTQHHHAHIASVMAEHGITDKIIGLAFDGTGYGTDKTLWGGEVLICAPSEFTRVAHLKPTKLPGGTKAIKEPWRMAYSYLKDSFGSEWCQLDLPALKQIPKDQLNILDQAHEQNLNSPITTSMGRLFDAVASLLDIKHKIQFEGQAAMMLEFLATNAKTSLDLPYKIHEKDNKIELDYDPLIQELVKNVINGTNKSVLARAFHETLITSIVELALRLKKTTRIHKVALSGGSWQNQILINNTTQKLQQNGFEVFTNELVPVNDGGISLGQAYIAAHSKKENLCV